MQVCVDLYKIVCLCVDNMYVCIKYILVLRGSKLLYTLMFVIVGEIVRLLILKINTEINMQA